MSENGDQKVTSFPKGIMYVFGAAALAIAGGSTLRSITDHFNFSNPAVNISISMAIVVPVATVAMALWWKGFINKPRIGAVIGALGGLYLGYDMGNQINEINTSQEIENAELYGGEEVTGEDFRSYICDSTNGRGDFVVVDGREKFVSCPGTSPQ